MAKKETKKTYYPTSADISNFDFCLKKGIVFSVRRIDNEKDAYYIQKYNPSKFNLISNLRINKSIPDIPSNRVIMNEYDAHKKIYELYKSTRDHMEEVIVEPIIQEKEEIKSSNKKPRQKIIKQDNQIDLLDMISEVEAENANKAKHL